MNDIVPVASSTYNQVIKSFGGTNYQSVKLSPGEQFLVSHQSVHGLQSLVSVIGELEAEPTKAAIRGLPLLPKNKPYVRARNLPHYSTHQ